MEMAFPSSDYYGGSVAIGLAPLRQSCIPYLNDDQDGLGAHFVPLRVLITPQLPRSVLGRRSIHPPIVQGALDVNHRFQPVLSTVWVLGFKQCSFHHVIRVLPSHPPSDDPRVLGFPDMLISPLAFAAR